MEAKFANYSRVKDAKLDRLEDQIAKNLEHSKTNFVNMNKTIHENSKLHVNKTIDLDL